MDDSNTGGGGYWPNRSTCKIFDGDGNFINDVSKTNGSGFKQVSDIKCSETPANSVPSLVGWEWHDRKWGFADQTSNLGCQNSKTKAQAQQYCMNNSSCGGYYAYTKNGTGRVCYKENINKNKGAFNQPGSGTTAPSGTGFWSKKKL